MIAWQEWVVHRWLNSFLPYEANVIKLTKDCKVCSDPDSKASFFNPMNAMVENVALFEALATLENEKKKLAESIVNGGRAQARTWERRGN